MQKAIGIILGFICFSSASAYDVEPRSATREVVSASKSSRSSPTKKEPIVYVSKTDTRFHSISCPRLHEVEDSFSLDDAMRAGYGPCRKCSREVLKRTSYKPLDRSTRRRSYRRPSGLVSGGPPYIVIVRPQHRTVDSLLPLIW